MFRDALLSRAGELVQVITAVEVITGTLLAVTEDTVIIRTSSVPSYGPPEDVIVRIPVISYVRVLG
ncbi:hypothetical protein MUG87_15050 [Ectobacillus sp. JY-23]|uniref:hypothetical protein n=1 Tax=Ectobacillus sp. JY-23 TaxID=2933872 RepID=UPI001FF2A4A0|nr:hypothetical protein [Ectobacillus sp. JY-23]UOY91798.1 hypothetical protein MUG87_15050 [Ectobacillus sp. JY-23]